MKRLAFTFCTAFCSDLLWAYYIKSIQAGNALVAGVLSAAIIGSGFFVFKRALEGRRQVAAACLGGFFGTYFVVKAGL